MKSCSLRQNLLATALLTACTSLASHAATLHWDGNDTTANADGGAGTWNATNTNWDDAATAGLATAWTNGDSAIFGGTAGTVTVAGNLQAASIVINSGYTFAGTASDSLNLGGASIDSSATTGAATDVNFNTVITGTGGLTIKAHGDLSATGGGSGAEFRLGGANTFTGGLNITGGLVSWTTDAGLGDAANTITLSNFGGLLFTGTSTSMGRNVVINSTGGTLRTYGSSTLTLTGQISGSGNVNRTDGGTIILTNATNSQSGTWNVQGGVLRVNGAGSFGTSVLNNTATVDFFNDATAGTYSNTINGNGTVRFESLAGTTYNGTISAASNVLVGDVTNGAAVTLGSAAAVTTGNLFLGETSGIAGNLTQSAGSAVTVSGQLRIGHWSNNTSTYTMNGGTLNLTGTPGAGLETPGIVILGVDGTGIFNQNGGTVTAAGIGLDARSDTAGTDQYNLNGGTLILGSRGIDGFASSEFNFGGGTLQGSSNFISTKGWNLNSNSTLNANGFTITQRGNITGTGSLQLSSATGALELNTTGTQTVSSNLTGVGSVNKTGTGTLTLSGSNSYSGATNLQAGIMVLSGSIAGNLNTSDATTLRGEGSIGGNLILGSSTGAALQIDPNTGSALAVAGTVTLNGTNTLSFSSAPLPTGSPITVFSHGGLTGTLGTNLVVDGASNYRSATFNNSGGLVTLDLGQKNLVWNGTTGGQWDLKTSSRWNTGEADIFAWGDSVRFDETGTTTAVTLTGDLRPSRITVDSTTKNYSLTGAVGGVGSLLKDGSSTLTLNGASTFSGGSTISEGTVIVSGSNGGLGTGTVTLGDSNTGAANVSLLLTNGRSISNSIVVSSLAGGTSTLGFSGTGGSYTAFTGAITLQKDLNIVGGTTDRLDFTGNITGTGNVNISGGQRITMGGTNTFSGNLSLQGTGTLFQTFNGNPVPDAAQVNVGTGSILQIFTSETIGSLVGSGTMRPIAGKPTLTIAGTVDATYSGTWVNEGSDHLNVVKNGSSVQTFGGNVTSPGSLTVNGGTVAFSGTANFSRTFAPGTAAPTRGILGSGIVRTDSGANLTLRRSGAEFTGTLQVGSGSTVTLGHNNAIGTGSVNLQGGTLSFDNSGANFTALSGLVMTGGTLTTDVTTSSFSTLHNTTGDVVPGNTTHVYHGQIYLTAGTWSFSKQFDDAGSVTIGGTTIVNNSTWNAVATGSFTASSDGWYTMDVRAQQGGGGVGPNSGWTAGIGIKQGAATTTPADYTPLADGALGTRIVTSNNISFGRGIAVNAASTINTSALVGTPGTTGSDGNGTGGDLTLTGAITGSANLTKAGNGSMILSTASNAYTGTFIVNGGSLIIQNGIQSAGGITVNAGGRLVTNSTNFFVGGHGTAVNASRVITVDGGTWVMDTGHDARIGNVTLSNGATWTSNRGIANYDALLANTNTGAATVNVTGTGASTMNGPGGLHLQGVQNFNVANTTGNSSPDLVVDMILAAQGTIGGDAGGVRKQGAGTMILNRTNTYTGSTIIEGGTLALGATGSIAASSAIIVGASSTLDVSAVSGFTIGSSQSLSGSGSISGDTNVSGTLAPGTSPGTLSFIDDLGLNASAITNIELNPLDLTLGAGVNDLIAVGGNLTLNGLMNVTASTGSFTGVSAGTWTIFSYGGTLTDNGFALGSMPTLDSGYSWQLNTSSPGSINITIIPEPQFALLGGLGMLMILRRRR